MRIMLNGKQAEFDDGLTVQGLLDMRGVSAAQVAVEINCSIVRREQFAEQGVHEGDVVEILRFVGGG